MAIADQDHSRVPMAVARLDLSRASIGPAAGLVGSVLISLDLSRASIGPAAGLVGCGLF